MMILKRNHIKLIFVSSLLLISNACFTALAQPQKVPAADSNSDTAPADHGIVGIRFLTFDRRLPRIFGVYPGTPAAKCGLQEGDEIVAVNGTPSTNMSDTKLQKLLLGKPDTRVVIKLRRNKVTFVKSLVRMHLVQFDKAYPDIAEHYVD